MGLRMNIGAVVFCNCFERGRLREAPPVGCRLAVGEDGSLQCGSDDFYVQADFAHWLRDRACDHEDGHLLERPLGDVAEICTILQEAPGRYPMILSRITYPAHYHEATLVAADQLAAFRAEVIALGDIHCQDPKRERAVRSFESNMAELIGCATFADKPIVFDEFVDDPIIFKWRISSEQPRGPAAPDQLR